MAKTDESLLEAHCRGEKGAFAILVRRYGDSLLGYLVRMCGDREVAEDLFQETFKRVHEKAGTFRGENFRSWLFTIATRVAVDRVRRQRRMRFVSLQRDDCENGGRAGGLGVVAWDGCDPAEQVEQAERLEQVREAIAMLPAKQRAALILSYYQRLSYPEVARVLGCSVGSVKRQMSRALQKLAQRLGPPGR